MHIYIRTISPQNDGPLGSKVCPIYGIKQTDGEVPIMIELWGNRSTPFLPYLTGPLCSGEVSPDRTLPMGQIKQNCVPMLK